MKNFVKILIFVLLIFRIILSFKLQLHPDEAYYWLWSKNLDFSYFDHPPMVAYFIKLTTIFSNSEFFVRFSTIICYLIFNFILYKLAKEMFNEYVGYLSLAIFNTFPANALGFIITPDISLMLFTILFLYFSFIALEKDKPKYWYLSGIACGFGLLSKYNAVLLIISIFFVILLVKEYRKFLFTKYLYLSILLSLIFFLPVVVWNYFNGWISFRYQFFHGIPQKAGNVNNVITYLSGQIVSLGLFLGIICLYVLIRSFFIKDKKIKFLIIFSAIPLLFFAITSYKSLAEMNWPLCSYPALAVLTSAYLFNNEKFKKYFLYPSISFCLFLIFIIYFHGIFRILPLEKFNPTWVLTDPTNWFYGWKEFAWFIDEQSFEYPIFTTNHQLASELIYYSKKNLDVFHDEFQFMLWNKDKEFPKNFYFINYESDVKTPSPQQKGFTSEFLKSYDVYRKNFRIRTYNIYLCRI
jgi:4-amino-4-deoxy-L-arabinose transferase-like glycosyltransferase